MIYYIADLHFDHSNIIKLSKRPYRDVDAMNEDFIKNWNSRVTNNDDVYIIGDLVYKSGCSAKEFLSRLNGKKHLIIGNHDKKLLQDRDALACLAERPKDLLSIQDGDRRVVLCHYPLVEWDGYFRGTLHIYGHVHNNVENFTYKILQMIPNSYNAGVDILDYMPRTLDEVIAMNKVFNEKHKTV